MADDTEDMTALRAEYAAKLGKAPFNGWDAETLRAKMAESDAGGADDVDEAGTIETAPSKTITLLGDHVHMPVDLMTPGWESATETQRYDAKDENDKRAKYVVHPDLADFLEGRDQAVIISED